ncbi:MAG: hypothetical protein ACJ790_15025 [Myxococcaceae bacterium]
MVRGALSSRHIVQVRLTDDVEATIYDRPGEWMSDEELELLRKQVRSVATAAIPGDLNYGVFLPTRTPYENRLIVIGRHLPTGDIVGFNAMPTFDVTLSGKKVRVLHLGLLVIHPKYQRRGFQGLLYGLGAFSLLHRIPETPVWMSNVTEVPAVFGAVADYFLNVWPDYKKQGQQAPDAHRALAKAIMADHRHEFGVGPDAAYDEERFVIMGSYTGGSDALKKTFDSAPKHRRDDANEFCKTQLDYSRGDDFLQIGQLDGTVISNWLTGRIPVAFRPAAARQMKLWRYPMQSPGT